MVEKKIDEIVVKDLATDGRRVELECGFTKSMGEGTYEFLRVDLRFSELVGDKTHSELADELYDEISTKLIELVQQIDRDLGPKSKSSRIHA